MLVVVVMEEDVVMVVVVKEKDVAVVAMVVELEENMESTILYVCVCNGSLPASFLPQRLRE